MDHNIESHEIALWSLTVMQGRSSLKNKLCTNGLHNQQLKRSWSFKIIKHFVKVAINNNNKIAKV